MRTKHPNLGPKGDVTWKWWFAPHFPTVSPNAVQGWGEGRRGWRLWGLKSRWCVAIQLCCELCQDCESCGSSNLQLCLGSHLSTVVFTCPLSSVDLCLICSWCMNVFSSSIQIALGIAVCRPEGTSSILMVLPRIWFTFWLDFFVLAAVERVMLNSVYYKTQVLSALLVHKTDLTAGATAQGCVPVGVGAEV